MGKKFPADKAKVAQCWIFFKPLPERKLYHRGFWNKNHEHEFLEDDKDLSDWLYRTNSDELFLGKTKIQLVDRRINYFDREEEKRKKKFSCVRLGKSKTGYHLALTLLKYPFLIPRSWEGKILLFESGYKQVTKHKKLLSGWYETRQIFHVLLCQKPDYLGSKFLCWKRCFKAKSKEK